jgi:hypothetical protein
MPLDIKNELQSIKDYYSQDPRQKRFSMLLTAESGAGKTFLLSTCPKPVLVDSFDPGGTKCLKPWIDKGEIIVDTRWENEDPSKPSVFKDWMKVTDERLRNNFYANFGTYALDSASTWADAVMNHQLGSKGRAGQAPLFTQDYTPQKVLMINYIKKLINVQCNFILTGHLRMIEETSGVRQDGSAVVSTKYRFLTTGQAMVSIPLQFDELYVLKTKRIPGGLERILLVESQGDYIARSRLKSDGHLNSEEPADVKALLKKLGLDYEDKKL